MRYTLLSSACLLAVLAAPVVAGQLFPPANIGSNPNAACPNGQVLSWDGSQVVCANPTAGVTVSCASGQVLTGILNGKPVCSSAGSGGETGGWTCTYFPYGFPNDGGHAAAGTSAASCMNSNTGATYIAQRANVPSETGTPVYDTHGSLLHAYQAALQALQAAEYSINTYPPYKLMSFDPKLKSLWDAMLQAETAYYNAASSADYKAGKPPAVETVAHLGYVMNQAQASVGSEEATANAQYLVPYQQAVDKAYKAWTSGN